MSQLKRNVIAASLAAAGMFAVAAPSMAIESAGQEIKVQTTVGSYMDWERVDGVKWTDAMQLTYVRSGSSRPNGFFQTFEMDTIVKPTKSGGAVSFTLKNDLTLVGGGQTVTGFKISVGGKELVKDTAETVVAKNESGVVGVGKKLVVTHDYGTLAVPLTKAKLVGHASIVLEGEA